MGRYSGMGLLAVVLALAAVAVAAVVQGPRAAGYLLAAVLALVGVARAVLPLRVAGPLAVRSRAVDVTCALGMATALAVVTWAVPL